MESTATASSKKRKFNVIDIDKNTDFATMDNLINNASSKQYPVINVSVCAATSHTGKLLPTKFIGIDKNCSDCLDPELNDCEEGDDDDIKRAMCAITHHDNYGILRGECPMNDMCRSECPNGAACQARHTYVNSWASLNASGFSNMLNDKCDWCQLPSFEHPRISPDVYCYRCLAIAQFMRLTGQGLSGGMMKDGKHLVCSHCTALKAAAAAAAVVDKK